LPPIQIFQAAVGNSQIGGHSFLMTKENPWRDFPEIVNRCWQTSVTQIVTILSCLLYQISAILMHTRGISVLTD